MYIHVYKYMYIYIHTHAKGYIHFAIPCNINPRGMSQQRRPHVSKHSHEASGLMTYPTGGYDMLVRGCPTGTRSYDHVDEA